MNGAAAHWFGAPFSPPLFLSPQPPPTSTIDPSGSSTVLACERGGGGPRPMLVVSFQPLGPLRLAEQRDPVGGERVAVRLECVRLGLVRSVARPGASRRGLRAASRPCPRPGSGPSVGVCQRSLGGLPSGENHHVSVVHAWPRGRGRSASRTGAGSRRPAGSGSPSTPSLPSSVTRPRPPRERDGVNSSRSSLLSPKPPAEATHDQRAPVGHHKVGRVPAPVLHVGLALPALGERVERVDVVEAGELLARRLDCAAGRCRR